MTTPVIITLIIVGGLVAISAISSIKDIVNKIIDGKRINTISKEGKK